MRGPLVLQLAEAADPAHPAWSRPWPGVDRRVLYEQEGASSAALLRYAPGAQSPRHRHQGFEHIYVLEGSQEDERGSYRAGTLVVNEPGSIHRVSSAEGCLVLLVWEKPIVFV